MKPKKQYLTLTPIIHDVVRGENLAYTEFKHKWVDEAFFDGVCPFYIHFEFVNQN